MCIKDRLGVGKRPSQIQEPGFWRSRVHCGRGGKSASVAQKASSPVKASRFPQRIVPLIYCVSHNHVTVNSCEKLNSGLSLPAGADEILTPK